MEQWYQLSPEAVILEQNSDIQNGLSDADASQRLAQYGPNELIEKSGKGPLHILWDQISSTMVLILIAAAVISGFLGKTTETIAIAAIVFLFAILGFVQEYRAEKAMAALKKLDCALGTGFQKWRGYSIVSP